MSVALENPLSFPDLPGECLESTAFSVRGHLQHIRALAAAGGPGPDDYDGLDLWHAATRQLFADGMLRREDLSEIKAAFGDAMSTATLQGWVAARLGGDMPHFQIVDRILTRFVSCNPQLVRWDHYFQHQPIANAFRARLHHFSEQLRSHPRFRSRDVFRVLVVGCGPGRDIHQFLLAEPFCRARFRCIDADPAALEHTRAINYAFSDHLMVPEEAPPEGIAAGKFDFVWAPGIFDSYDDSACQLVLRAMLTAVDCGGCIVIPNLPDNLCGRAFLEFCGWNVRTRSNETLLRLARECGVDDQRSRARCDSDGLNLFLRIEV